jgi:hypothetical protein
MNGECGHQWFITIFQHKGQTFLNCEVPLEQMPSE